MRYRRLPIEIESPEEMGYATIANNLSESSYRDMRLSDYGIDADVGSLLLQYGDHRGVPELREAIAGDGVGPADVLVTPGAAAALFIVATALLDEGAHALVARPNYATNLETPRALGAEVEHLDLRFEDAWRLDVEAVAAALRPNTRLVSICVPHNPTGRTLDPSALRAIVDLVERHGSARLLVDETYRELAYGEPLPLAAGLSERVIGVSSMSKTYGLPGLRIGWLTCRDRDLMVTFLAAKEQIVITGAAIDETMAARVLEQRGRILPAVQREVAAALSTVRTWMDGQDVFEWVEPQAGVVCFPRIRAEHAVDTARFYEALLDQHGTYVGPGHWFEQDPRSFRLGFGWPQPQELERGLAGLMAAAADAAA